jgi:hypothetical protein
MNQKTVTIPLGKIKSTFEALKIRINLPDKARREHTTGDFYHSNEKNTYSSFISSISEMDSFFSKKNEEHILERDLEYFHEQRKILHNEAAKNICTVIEYFSHEFLSDQGQKDFTDKTEEYNTLVLMAAQQTDMLLPAYMKTVIQAAFYSPFESVKEIAADLFSRYDRDQVTNFYSRDQKFVKDIREYIRRKQQ